MFESGQNKGKVCNLESGQNKGKVCNLESGQTKGKVCLKVVRTRVKYV